MFHLGEYIFYLKMHSTLLRWKIYASCQGFERYQRDKIGPITHNEQGAEGKKYCNR